MAISKTMEEAVATKDLGKIYSSFYTILLSDPGFSTGKFDEAFTYVKSKKIQGFVQRFDGVAFEDENEWSQEYWDRLASELMDNFSLERIDFLKKVGKKVYQEVQTGASTQNKSQEQKKTKPVSSKKYHQSPVNGKLIAIVTGVIVLLIIVLVLVP